MIPTSREAVKSKYDRLGIRKGAIDSWKVPMTKSQKNLEFWILTCYNVIVPGNDNRPSRINEMPLEKESPKVLFTMRKSLLIVRAHVLTKQ
jgi:hypothetical protein